MGQIINDEASPYSHSPVHLAVLRGDHAALRRLLNGLPNLPKAGEVVTEADSVRAEEKAELLSSMIDRRDVPGRETPLHLAVRLGDATAVDMLMAKGADWSLQNERGWSSLQEAVCTRQEALAMIIIKHYQPLAWAKWCRRLPRIIGSMKRMRDFYMEVTFNFESSVIPFISRIAPSDTYKIWKRGPNLRADMTLAGFDGFWIQRCDQSFIFLGEGTDDGKLPPGSLCLLNHKEKEVMNALEGAGATQSEAEIAQEVAAMSRTNVYRPGIDVTQAELVPNLNWRKQEKVEMVGPWKSKVYDMHHVVISVRSRRVPGAMSDAELFGVHEEREEDEEEEFEDGTYKDLLTDDEQHQLDHALKAQEFDDTGFVEARSSLAGCNGTLAERMAEDDDNEQRRTKDKKKWFLFTKKNANRDGTKKVVPYRGSLNIEAGETDSDPDTKLLRRHSDFIAEEGMSRKGKEKIGRQSSSREPIRNSRVSGNEDSESEYKKGLRPSLWLTQDFPLKIEELIPLLDVLASKVKAIKRLRELLTTKLPPGTFPVKMAIPVVPTIRVVVTFSKFQELESEEFHTPLSSPSQFDEEEASAELLKAPQQQSSSSSSSSWIPWMKGSQSSAKPANLEDHLKLESDPFRIPDDYVWIDLNEKKKRMKDKKSKRKKGKKQQQQASSDAIRIDATH